MDNKSRSLRPFFFKMEKWEPARNKNFGEMDRCILVYITGIWMILIACYYEVDKHLMVSR